MSTACEPEFKMWRFWLHRPDVSRGRLIAAFTYAVAAPPTLAWVLSVSPNSPESADALSVMLFLALVVVAAMLGGHIPAVLCTLESVFLTSWFFLPPLHDLSIASPTHLLALVTMVAVGLMVSSLVSQATALASMATESKRQSQVLFALTEEVLDSHSLTEALDHVRAIFRVSGVRLSADPADPKAEDIEVGCPVAARGEVSTTLTLPDGRRLELIGHPLKPGDKIVLTSFSTHLGARIERDRLRRLEDDMASMKAREALQNALLAAVSHDLRTPLASIKASSSSLVNPQIEFSAADRQQLIELVDTNADRLALLIGNLLDMTRLRTGHLTPNLREVLVDELLGPVMLATPDQVKVQIEPGLPMVCTDVGLAERIVGNIFSNALRYAGDQPVNVRASRCHNGVAVSIIDHGIGVPEEMRTALFQPFQQLGDVPDGSGLGLGLTVARGFANAVDATISASDTPGGGLSMTIVFPTAAPSNREFSKSQASNCQTTNRQTSPGTTSALAESHLAALEEKHA